MNLTHLIYFQTIAETGNVTQAAKKLFISQPSLSKALNILEQDLDCKLFDRIGKMLVLNEQGRIFLKYTNQIIDCLADARKEIADCYDISANTVNILISSGAKYFVSLLAELRKEHPEIRFHITDRSDRNQSDPLPDLSIFASEEESPFDNCETLFREKLALAVPVSHPLAGKSSVVFSDFMDELFLATAEGTSMRHSLDRYCASKDFSPRFACESANSSLIKTMVMNGLGTALVPSVTWADVEELKLAKIIPVSDIDFCRYIHIQWNDERYLTLACKKTLEFLFSKHK